MKRFAIWQDTLNIWQPLAYKGLQSSIWSNTLHKMASRRRGALLRDIGALAPLIEHLGGKAAIKEVFYAIRDVVRWWS